MSVAVPSITYWVIDTSNFVHPVMYKPGCLLYELVYKRWKPTLACRHIHAYDKLTITIHLDENERVTTIELYLLADYRYIIDKRMMTECWCDRSPAPCTTVVYLVGEEALSLLVTRTDDWLGGARAVTTSASCVIMSVVIKPCLFRVIWFTLIPTFPWATGSVVK